MTDKRYSPMTNEDDEEQHFKLMQKLQAKHDDLFEKIVFAQREDKEDIANTIFSKRLSCFVCNF